MLPFGYISISKQNYLIGCIDIDIINKNNIQKVLLIEVYLIQYYLVKNEFDRAHVPCLPYSTATAIIYSRDSSVNGLSQYLLLKYCSVFKETVLITFSHFKVFQNKFLLF